MKRGALEPKASLEERSLDRIEGCMEPIQLSAEDSDLSPSSGSAPTVPNRGAGRSATSRATASGEMPPRPAVIWFSVRDAVGATEYRLVVDPDDFNAHVEQKFLDAAGGESWRPPLRTPQRGSELRVLAMAYLLVGGYHPRDLGTLPEGVFVFLSG